ncbi:hypothetical protein YC2023_019049 [Brassica napus]|uniref:Uncharacterized protein n=1 Tax=Brassica oleracea TaxID=3712 RepID=A0A3P6DGE0_BRAOL|nr:unnamed protein product [Brassica oleracea]
MFFFSRGKKVIKAEPKSTYHKYKHTSFYLLILLLLRSQTLTFRFTFQTTKDQ